MKTIITTTVTLSFIWLSHYAYTHRPEEAAYRQSAFTVLDQAKSLKQRQAEALAYIYGITPEEAAKPVVLWEGQPHE